MIITTDLKRLLSQHAASPIPVIQCHTNGDVQLLGKLRERIAERMVASK